MTEVRRRIQGSTSRLPSKSSNKIAEMTMLIDSPLVRTNPVTGWKSLFGAGQQVENGWIEGVTSIESEVLKGLCEFTEP